MNGALLSIYLTPPFKIHPTARKEVPVPIIVKKTDFRRPRKRLYSSRLTFNNLTNLTKILMRQNSMQQVLFHFSRSTESIKIFSYYKKPWAI